MKIGDYVRTDTGKIAKINKIYNQSKTNDSHIELNRLGSGRSVFILDNGTNEENHLMYSYGDVIKSSPNIIDLIEEGDYVNGHKVIYTIGNIYKRIYVEYVNMDELLEIKLEQIKSIVTREMFENMEYKVGEENE